VYRAEGIVGELVRRITAAVSRITPHFEIILVEDGSPDNSWGEIEAACAQDARVKGIKLSRNFGQHYAITAGLDQSQGEWTVVMDCDLQDQPEEIGKMLSKAISGDFDFVLASRYNRQDSWFKRFVSLFFYRVLSFLTGKEYDGTVANFGVYNRQVVQAVISMREHIRSFPTMVKWVGFSATTVEVEHAAREVGTSSYDFKRLVNLALDIMLAYSDKPLKMTIKLGFIISFFAFLFTMHTIFLALRGEIAVLGYTSIFSSIWLLGGLIITILGVVGLYVGKIFEGVKNRPIYLVKKTIGIDERK